MTTAYENLTKIGLTRGEAKVYLALLELGSSTVGPIVKKSGIAYSNIYEVLQRLIGKGLATFIIKNKTKYFQAADPEYLKEYLERREKEIKQNKEFLEEIIPKIREMQKIKPDQEAEIYVGFAGLKAAYAKALLNHKGEWLWFYQKQGEYIKEVETFYPRLRDLMVRCKAAIRGIASESHRTSKLYKRLKRFQDTRFVNFPVPANMDIIGDTVLIETLREPMITFAIKSTSIAEDMRNYFYSVWKVAKK